MVTVAKLNADLTVNSSRFEAGFNRANALVSRSQQQWARSLNASGKNFNTFSVKVDAAISRIGNIRGELGQLAGVAASALSIQKVAEYSDKWKQMQGRLAIVSNNMSEITYKQDKLFQLAQDAGAPLESISNLYTKINNSLSEQQRRQYDVMGITKTFTQALAITGETAASAQGAILQFNQAIATDFKSSGQELNSIIEQAPRVAKAIADGYGVTIGELKRLSKDGKLSTQGVLEALEKGGIKIDEEFKKIPKTITRALQELDNAFLQYIGRSDAIQEGTTSVALGISQLAKNFDDLAEAVSLIAVAITSRYVGAMLASRGATIATTIALVAETRALEQNAAARAAAVASANLGIGAGARYTPIAAVVQKDATAVMGLSSAMVAARAGAARLGAGLLAAFGGPVGAAITAISIGIYAIANATTEADRRQAEHNKTLSRLAELNDVILRGTAAQIKAAKEQRLAELANAEAILATARAKVISMTITNGDKFMGTRSDQNRAIDDMMAASKNFLEIQKIIDQAKQLEAAVGNVNIGGGGSGSKKKDAYKEILNDLKLESAQIEKQVELYGQKEAVVNKAKKQLEIQNKLAEAGVKLTRAQQEELDKYLDKIEQQSILYEDLEKLEKEREEQLKRHQDMIDDLGTSFESAFEDAVVSGEKLSDVLNALLEDILRILIRTNITQPLVQGFGTMFGGAANDNSGGGLFDGIFSSIGDMFSGFSFATGTDYVPKDMWARVHKGEKITRASEVGAEERRGSEVNISVMNNNGSKVNASAQQSADGTDVTILIDQAVAENMNKPGSKTYQAMNNFSNRSLIRR